MSHRGQKLKVRKIIVSDKIYFNIEDVIEEYERDDIHYHFLHRHYKEVYSTLTEHGNGIVSIPSNAWWKLDYEEVIDNRNYPKRESIPFHVTLRSYQKSVPPQFLETKNGIARSGLIQAECGWGKTFVGCYLITQIPTSALVLVHTKLLFRQWEDEMRKQTGYQPGLVGDGVFNPKPVTIGIYKSVNNNIDKLAEKYGLVIVDEAHRCPAETFSLALNNINARIKIGMTATPRRTDGKHVILPEYFTPFKVVGEPPPEVDDIFYIIHQTPYNFHFTDPKAGRARELSKLNTNFAYQERIANLAKEDIRNGRCPLIQSERLDMLRNIQKMIPQSVLLIGPTSQDKREEIIRRAGEKYSAILSNVIFDEGVSCHRLDTIYLTCPTGNIDKIEQRIGRIKREHPDKKEPLIRDFWFHGRELQQEKRLNWFKQKGFKEWKNLSSNPVG